MQFTALSVDERVEEVGLDEDVVWLLRGKGAVVVI